MKRPDYSIVPNMLSDLTKEGVCKGNTNDIMQAMSRMATIQDDAYFEVFEEIQSKLEEQSIIQKAILDTITALREQIKELRTEVWELKNQIGEIAKVADNTKKDVVQLQKDVDVLMRHDTLFSHAIRIGIGILLGLLSFLEIHKYWLHK